jgi:hypothetical protein
MKYLYPLFFVFILSCKNKDAAVEEASSDSLYPDGTYCATVQYYNPATGTNRTYTLNVEVESNEVTKIYFSNGGYLDNSHINPETLSSSGTCSITDDQNRDFDIRINGSACAAIDNIDDNNGPEEKFTLTLEQCAATIPMTEKELSEYEQKYNTSRHERITEEWCHKLFDYITTSREQKMKIENMESQMANGYIQKLKSIGDDDDVRCQTMIVLRKGTYYLLEIAGRRRAIMGLTDFNPTHSDWQHIAIKESFESTTMPVFEARVINSSSLMSILESEMDSYCQ